MVGEIHPLSKVGDQLEALGLGLSLPFDETESDFQNLVHRVGSPARDPEFRAGSAPSARGCSQICTAAPPHYRLLAPLVQQIGPALPEPEQFAGAKTQLAHRTARYSAAFGCALVIGGCFGEDTAAMAAQGYVRAIVDFCWYGTGGPRVAESPLTRCSHES